MAAEFMGDVIDGLRYHLLSATGPMAPREMEEFVNAARAVVKAYDKGPPAEINADSVLQIIRRDGGLVEDILRHVKDPIVEDPTAVSRARQREGLIRKLDGYLSAGGTLPSAWKRAQSPRS